MKKWLRHFFEQVFDYLFNLLSVLLFPERDTEKVVSGFSVDDFPLLTPASTVTDTASVCHIISLFSYKDPRVQALIWELKYRRNPRAIEFAAQALTERIVAELEEKILFGGWSISRGGDASAIFLTTIPTTSQRLHERTYSHMDLLCRAVIKNLEKHFGKNFPIIYRPDLVEKIRDTPRQNKVANRAERLTNLRGAFRARVLAAEKHIILIDDVTTTGATINEVRQTLLIAGARDIIAFTVAH